MVDIFLINTLFVLSTLNISIAKRRVSIVGFPALLIQKYNLYYIIILLFV